MFSPLSSRQRWLLLAFILCISFDSFCQYQPDNSDLVPVTTRFAVAKKAKHHNYRLQLMLRHDSIAVVGFGFTRLTKSLKSLRFEAYGKVRRPVLEESANQSFDSVYRFNLSLGKNLGFIAPAPQEYEKYKLRFLAGKRAPAYYTSQWVRFASLPIEDGLPLGFDTKGTFKSHHRYVTDFLPAGIAWAFPALDPWNCGPATLQFIKLRKLQGYGTDKIKYTPYTVTSRMIVRNAFEVYFAQNETTPDRSGMERIMKYLDQNAFVILNAELEGGCSVEGSAERNEYLQKERAKVLQKTLHRFADELIKKDTVLFTDDLLQFRELVRTHHQFKWLDTLSDEVLRATINRNQNLKKALEPIFVLQRRASLKLVMAKRLTRQEQFSKFLNDLNKAVSIWHNARHDTPEGEHKIMGMLDKLFSDYENKYITDQEIKDIINETTYPDNLRVLLGYHLLKKFEDRAWPGKKTWKEYWNENNVAQWLDEGRQSLIALAQSTNARDKRTKYFRMLTDYQVYNYEFIEMGLIEPNTLCQIPYPELPEFMGLILNQYAYLYEIAGRTGTSMQCIPECKPRDHHKDSTVNADKFVEEVLQKNETKSYALIGTRLVKLKSFDQTPKGAYYYLLKQHYLKNNSAVLNNVAYENSSANVELNVFNLWHLTYANVSRWDPFENHFYDEEVQADEMARLIGSLHSLDKHLCKPQINNLYLEYHLKVLYYLERFQEAGNAKHVKYADTSLKFISDYYKSRAKHITPKLSMHIIRQLNAFNWLPGLQHGAWYGYELLTAISKERILSEEEMKLFAHYLKLYNPELKRMPSITLDKEKLIALMDEGY